MLDILSPQAMHTSNLKSIGSHVRQRRLAVGLSQQRLAKLAGLSRATINQLETGALIDLGVSKLSNLLNLLGLRLEATEPPKRRRRGLVIASRTASVSYKTGLEAKALAQALATGVIPAAWLPHVGTLIDEAPLSLIVAAVDEAARTQGIPAKRIWQHLTRWSHEMRSPRPAWA